MGNQINGRDLNIELQIYLVGNKSTKSEREVNVKV